MDGAPQPQKQWIDCPGCGESFDLTSEPQAARTFTTDGLMRCPYCSTPFLPSTSLSVSAKEPIVPEPTARNPGPDEFYVTDDLPPDYDPTGVRAGALLSDHMSADKVHQLAAARRNAYRRRSWFAISAGVLAVAAIQFLLLVVAHLRAGDGATARVLAYGATAIVMLLLAARLVQRAIRLTRRLRESDLDEPAQAPDFTPLEIENTDAAQWHRANQN